ncbi:hypothetical protein E1293_33115 [Actinomadura darangshiensis]|uniref:HTH cro/C1-type domain-containing protein n=1 Tax=Actinomadura darangshiensis TaxID=705336 RepID=A0A4V2YT23_9ACTN|nr:hypothetical protein [Actinomadura darangshiensis]TDD72117.1 hypothetical protein E1293_33115 [Actinomadura darangshiensis]
MPLEFWFSESISQALAIWDWPTILIAINRDTKATQSAIATQTGLSQASVSRLMAGRSGGQTIETALKIIDRLGAPRTLAGITPRGLSHITSRIDDRETVEASTGGNVKRREFSSKLVLAGLAIPLLGSAHTKATTGDVDVVTGLERPADAVADLWALDSRHGGAALADLAEARLASILGQLKHVTIKPSAEPFVHAVIGEVTSAAAWFAFERGDLARAEGLLKDGLYSAYCANDTKLRLQILDTMAMVCNAKGRPANAASVAQSALDASQHADLQLRSLLSMRAAVAHARLHDETDYERLKGQAWDLLGKAAVRPDRDEWFRFFGEDEMRGLEALAQASLDHHALSAELLDGITATMAPRNRAFYRVCQATALARSGDITSSVDVFHSNLPLLTEMTSARIAKKTRRFAAALHGSPSQVAQETRRMALNLIGASSHA